VLLECFDIAFLLMIQPELEEGLEFQGVRRSAIQVTAPIVISVGGGRDKLK